MSSDNFEPRVTPWQLEESDFYELESDREQIEFLLRYAVLAPSSHNTQPWMFGIVEDGVRVFADYSRRLMVSDPDDRELLMSVGAAITNRKQKAEGRKQKVFFLLSAFCFLPYFNAAR